MMVSGRERARCSVLNGVKDTMKKLLNYIVAEVMRNMNDTGLSIKKVPASPDVHPSSLFVCFDQVKPQCLFKLCFHKNTNRLSTILEWGTVGYHEYPPYVNPENVLSREQVAVNGCVDTRFMRQIKENTKIKIYKFPPLNHPKLLERCIAKSDSIVATINDDFNDFVVPFIKDLKEGRVRIVET